MGLEIFVLRSNGLMMSNLADCQSLFRAELAYCGSTKEHFESVALLMMVFLVTG